jgi:hypothetical protein
MSHDRRMTRRADYPLELFRMADLKSGEELRAASQETLIDVLQTELEMCETFAALVETEQDKRRALGAFRKAERGCELIQPFMERIQDVTQRREIEQGLDSLLSRLARFGTNRRLTP